MKRLVLVIVILLLLPILASAQSTSQITPPLANDQFALVCNYVSTLDMESLKTSGTSGQTTFVFNENEKKLELIDLLGSCGKVINYRATNSNILIECEAVLSDESSALYTYDINRFSGEIENMFQIKKNGEIAKGGLIHSGICKKTTKKF